MFDLKVIDFDRLKIDPQSVANDVFDFLNAEPFTTDPVHSNRSTFPSSKLSFHMNRVGRHLAEYRYANHFNGNRPFLNHLDRKWHGWTLKTMRAMSAPPIPAELHERLSEHFRARNVGLSEFLDVEWSK